MTFAGWRPARLDRAAIIQTSVFSDRVGDLSSAEDALWQIFGILNV